MKKIKGIIITIIGLLIFSGCTEKKAEEKPKEHKLKVVTTFYPVYNFTQNVVGDKGDISMLITGETEPHDFEPSAKDIAKIQEADVFVFNSNEMETWVKTVLESVDTKKTKIIEASKGIELLEAEKKDNDEEEEEHGHEHAHGADPHVWLDPVLVEEEVATIAKGFIEVDAKNKDFYQKNADDYQDDLETLNEKFETTFKEAKNRTFVTQHAAFAYLAKRYDLHQISISGISPDQEPSPAELAKIETFVKENDVKVIYTEDLASEKIAKTITDATGAKLATLSTLEGMSHEDKDKGMNYLRIMERNLDELKKSIK